MAAVVDSPFKFPWLYQTYVADLRNRGMKVKHMLYYQQFEILKRIINSEICLQTCQSILFASTDVISKLGMKQSIVIVWLVILKLQS